MKPADVTSLRVLRRARDRFDRDYAEPVGIAALADGAVYSREHFIRAFRAAYSETPGRAAADGGWTGQAWPTVSSWRIPNPETRWPGANCAPPTRTGTGWSRCCGCPRATAG